MLETARVLSCSCNTQLVTRVLLKNPIVSLAQPLHMIAGLKVKIVLSMRQLVSRTQRNM